MNDHVSRDDLMVMADSNWSNSDDALTHYVIMLNTAFSHII